MQVESHAGYKTGDAWTRWLPEYDQRSYPAKVILCKTAINYWQVNLEKATRGSMKVKTDIARKRWDIRADWCQANVSRWRTTLRQCMVDEGILAISGVPLDE